MQKSTTQILNEYGIIPSYVETTAYDMLKMKLPIDLCINILKYQLPNEEEILENARRSKWWCENIGSVKQCYRNMQYNYPKLICFIKEQPLELRQGPFGDYIQFRNIKYKIYNGKYGYYIKYNNKFCNLKYDKLEELKKIFE